MLLVFLILITNHKSATFRQHSAVQLIARGQLARSSSPTVCNFYKEDKIYHLTM